MDDLLFDGLRILAHNIKIWHLKNKHLRRARKNKSIVELLISLCYDEEETRWQYTKDKSEIICEAHQRNLSWIDGKPSIINSD